MKSRWIAGVLCLLYVSVSTVFAAIHHHDSDLPGGKDQCAACAWHHDAQADVPVVAVAVRPPLEIVSSESARAVLLPELSPKLHPSRGPPVFSLQPIP